MLWTIMPEDAVLEGFDQKRDYRYQQYMGKGVIVESQENGKGVIVQLLSTDPNDYLSRLYAPGTEIMLEQEQKCQSKT